ncbi:hypothetical protein [Alteromonas facilis]|uniref:hypothetical protein n=1 Tax=Alteromonas facilis TaxID=2048004 RepID=UPI0013DA4731|nr:hypothetical protein [Alteromonas facilis]
MGNTNRVVKNVDAELYELKEADLERIYGGTLSSKLDNEIDGPIEGGIEPWKKRKPKGN